MYCLKLSLVCRNERSDMHDRNIFMRPFLNFLLMLQKYHIHSLKRHIEFHHRMGNSKMLGNDDQRCKGNLTSCQRDKSKHLLDHSDQQLAKLKHQHRQYSCIRVDSYNSYLDNPQDHTSNSFHQNPKVLACRVGTTKSDPSFQDLLEEELFQSRYVEIFVLKFVLNLSWYWCFSSKKVGDLTFISYSSFVTIDNYL